jgi:peptide deformylase
MDRTDIIALPHSSLRQKSQKISQFNDAVSQLVADMEAATLDWEDHRQHELGVALAAVQVNRLQRVVVIRNDFEDKSDRSFLALINPKVIRREGALVTDYEGCLSVPDIYGKVPRYERIKLKAQDISGQEFRLSADGFLARVLQHEIDHTNGQLFIDHIKGVKDAFYRLDEEGKLQELTYGDIDTNRFLWD